MNCAWIRIQGLVFCCGIRERLREREKIFYCGCIIIQTSREGDMPEDTIEKNNNDIVIIIFQSVMSCNHRRQARVS